MSGATRMGRPLIQRDRASLADTGGHGDVAFMARSAATRRSALQIAGVPAMSSEFECEQILLVQADWDGELSATESAAIHSHRRDCEACSRAYETLQFTRSALRKVP